MTCTEGLQPVEGQENMYNIRTSDPVDLRRCKASPIVLRSQDPNIPLPNRTYLAIHASCCRVAHLSGAADYIDEEYDSDDEESSKVLSLAMGPITPPMTWAELLILSPAVGYCIIYLLILKPTLHTLLRTIWPKTQNVQVAST
jgi:hypothetical protein